MRILAHRDDAAAVGFIRSMFGAQAARKVAAAPAAAPSAKQKMFGFLRR